MTRTSGSSGGSSSSSSSSSSYDPEKNKIGSASKSASGSGPNPGYTVPDYKDGSTTSSSVLEKSDTGTGLGDGGTKSGTGAQTWWDEVINGKRVVGMPGTPDSLSPTTGSDDDWGGSTTGPTGPGTGGDGTGGPMPEPDGDGTGGDGDGGGGDIGTTINTNPRGDFSVVLAGLQGERANRGPARSNSFISLIGGAGGLGRRTSEAKRTLIGGA